MRRPGSSLVTPEARRVAVLGAGSWGTALGDLLARNGHRVTLWSHDPAVADQVRREGRNDKYLEGWQLAEGLDATGDMDEALEGAEILVCATPSHAVREVASSAVRHLDPATAPWVISGSKGLETGTGLRMSEVLGEVLGEALGPGCGEEIVVISGPSFADEVVRRLPTAVAAASYSPERAAEAQCILQSEHMRIYTQGDVVGTELGGALKNVIAVAAGIGDGLRLGANARAALMTRGLAEIGRLAHAAGGEEATLAGLAGVGDLVLTCTGDLSRNRRVGLGIGSGQSLEEAIARVREVAEGVPTALAARELAERHGVEMPITAAVYSVLYEGVDPRRALAELMARAPKPERWS